MKLEPPIRPMSMKQPEIAEVWEIFFQKIDDESFLFFVITLLTAKSGALLELLRLGNIGRIA